MICHLLLTTALAITIAAENVERFQDQPLRFARRGYPVAGGYGGAIAPQGLNGAAYGVNGYGGAGYGPGVVGPVGSGAIGYPGAVAGGATTSSSSTTTSTSTTSTTYSFDQIYGTYQGLLLQIQQCQAALAAGGISAQMATQSLYQLAYQFQNQLGPYGTCGACGIGGTSISTFGGIVQQIVASFQQLLITTQSLFPNAWTGILGSAWTPLNYAFPILLNMVQSAGLTIGSYFSHSFLSYFSQISSLSGITSAFNRFGIM